MKPGQARARTWFQLAQAQPVDGLGEPKSANLHP